MGCALVLPAMCCGFVTGVVTGVVFGVEAGTLVRQTSPIIPTIACIMGMLCWASHRLFLGQIWTTGPGAGKNASAKALCCGLGNLLMFFGLSASLTSGVMLLEESRDVPRAHWSLGASVVCLCLIAVTYLVAFRSKDGVFSDGPSGDWSREEKAR
eukprot:gnl/TRDRNA2_/TRDRNA2_175979_c2_seq4.p1 gnl/TRDRNA2_/TRDRNA2_175979_c2~~gnl/TRDRNA2_/TRDRNA2_175979_c2_seq4.p1  ORF type:complete len:167 (-),score=12.96 gnl/TRDRNA2_/TRDRNA2_175979_c2_seq4:403-867(-)